MTEMIELADMDFKLSDVTIFYIFKKPKKRLSILSKGMEEYQGISW